MATVYRGRDPHPFHLILLLRHIEKNGIEKNGESAGDEYPRLISGSRGVLTETTSYLIPNGLIQNPREGDS